MDAHIFAEWLRCQGHHIVETESSFWYDQGPHVFQAFPYHWLVRPVESEFSNLFFRHQAIALRYSTDLEFPPGRKSYHAIYQNQIYNLDKIDKASRKNVKNRSKGCIVKRITFECLAEKGWALLKDTLDRQGRKLKVSYADWRNRCMAAASLDGFGAWGTFVDGELAASVITFQMKDCIYLLNQQCHRKYLDFRVNNVLCFKVTETLIREPGIRMIFYGLHSLDAPPSVDEFKFRMGYTRKKVLQRVVFHPLVEPFINPTSYKVMRLVKDIFPGNVLFSKLTGMMDFYLEGYLPLDEQSEPGGVSRPLRQKKPCIDER